MVFLQDEVQRENAFISQFLHVNRKTNEVECKANMTAEMSSDKDYGNQFAGEAAAVLLSAFGLTELLSVLGLSVSGTMVLPYPFDKIFGLSFFMFCLAGSFSLYRRKVAGAYLAILASVFMVVLGCLSVAHQTDLIAGVATVLIGSLVLLCIFKMPPNQVNLHKTDSVLSASSEGSKHSSDVEEHFAVETYDVDKKYFLDQNVVQAVNGITMKIRKGEFVAIMGPSGSGKSTLLNLLGALDKPSAGQVLIDGVDISLLDDNGLAKLRNKKIGFVFQAYNLIARSTVMRNMELPAFVRGYSREERLGRVTDLLSIVGLGGKLTRKPNTLSGGEQQRVAIARALMNNPEILLADEPTGNVDSKQGLIIMSFLRKLNEEKGVTIIVVTHDIEVAKTADRIVFIRDGRIASKEVGGVAQ